MQRGILALLFFAFSACSLPQAPEEYLLSGPRVIALVADKPDVSAGEVVTITPYISDINGEGRAMSFTAEACVKGSYWDYGNVRGTDCQPEYTGYQVISPGVVSGLSAPNYTGAVTPFSFTAPSIPGCGSEPGICFAGISYQVNYTVTLGDGRMIRARRFILISTRPTKNQNPSFTAINASGAPLASLPVSKVTLEPLSSPPETIPDVAGGVLFTEKYTYSYLVSSGSLHNQTTANAVFTPPGTRPARGVVLIGVIRDSLGGSAVQILNL